MKIRHVQMLSGGLSSWFSSMLVKERHSPPEMLFTDTLIEDEDLYRFLIEGAAVTSDVPLERVKKLTAACNRLPGIDKQTDRLTALEELSSEATTKIPLLHWQIEGRTPWQVFNDVKFIGNSRRARCSHDLKQKVARKWLEDNCNP